MFSYSGRVKSPEWRWQRRREYLQHFEIFRHGPIIIYTRLPAGGTYYPICILPASSECLIAVSNAFSAFCLRVSVIFPACSLYPQQKRASSALHPQARTYIQVHAQRLLPSAVPWISKDRLLALERCHTNLWWRMWLWWSLCTGYLLACQVRVTGGDLDLFSCLCDFCVLTNSVACLV